MFKGGCDVQTVVAIPRLEPKKPAEVDNAVANPEPMLAPTVLTAVATAAPTVLAVAPTVVPAAAAMSGAPAAAAVVAAASYGTYQSEFTNETIESSKAYRDDEDTRRRVGNRVVVLAIVYEDFEREPDPPDVLELDGLSGLDLVGEMECADVFERDVEFSGGVVRDADAGHYYKVRKRSLERCQVV